MKVHLFQLLLNYWAVGAYLTVWKELVSSIGAKSGHIRISCLYIFSSEDLFLQKGHLSFLQIIRVEWNIMFLNLKHSISNMCFPKRQILPIFRAQHF